VIDGWLKLYRTAPSGEETVITMLKKGDSFAESVALTGNRYLASAEAVTDARVACIPADHIVHCIRQNPGDRAGHDCLDLAALEGLIRQIEQLKASQEVARLRYLAGEDRGAVRGTL
jgi:CRP-like cAMP-binding protein